MKKEQTITAILGITQQDAAMLLGVNRSQWSMFESGKRDLPLAAKQLLAEMLTYLQSSEASAKNMLPEPSPAAQHQLERLLRENQYQQLLLEKKIAAATKKLHAQARLLQLTAFLSSRDNSKTSAIQFPTALVSKARQAPESALLAKLTEQQLRKEMLVLENLLLESRLRKLRLGS